jgi:hypothetical protein
MRSFTRTAIFARSGAQEPHDVSTQNQSEKPLAVVEL